MKQITHIGTHAMRYTTMIDENGDIKWICRNDKGQQSSVVKALFEMGLQRSGYIKLPVQDSRNRPKDVDFDWCDLYEQHYRACELPSILQRIKELRALPRRHKPCPQTQLSLFALDANDDGPQQSV